MAQPTTAKYGKMRIMLGRYPEVEVLLTSVSNTNPAVATVGAGDIAKFTNGQTIVVSGLTGDMVAGNGSHAIASVGSPANTFQLVGVDLSTAAAAQTTGKTTVTDTSGAVDYISPCGLTTKGLTISKNLQEIDIPDCDDPDAPSWIARDVQNLSVTINGDGVAAAESVPDWNAAAISTESVPMRVEIEFSTGTKEFEGDFIVDNLAFGAEQGGRVTLSFNAQSDGQVQDQWVPV